MEFNVVKPIKKAIKRYANKIERSNAKIVYTSDGKYMIQVDSKIYPILNDRLETFIDKDNIVIYPSKINDKYYKDEFDRVCVKHFILDIENFNNKSDYARKVVNKYWKYYYEGQKVLKYTFSSDKKSIIIIQLSKRKPK